jgi:hypothetical protein
VPLFSGGTPDARARAFLDAVRPETGRWFFENNYRATYDLLPATAG